MSHVVICKNGRIAFSTTLFSNSRAICDISLEEYMTPKGLILPTGSLSLHYARWIQTGDDDNLRVMGEYPGHILSPNGLCYTIMPKDDHPYLFRAVPALHGTWATYDGGHELTDAYHEFLVGITELKDSADDVLDYLRTRIPRFSDRGYCVYDVASLLGWIVAWKKAPDGIKPTYEEYLTMAK